MSIHDEGHTVAGWTGTGIATVGGSVAGVGVCVTSPVLIAAGVAVMAVSVLVTWALHLTGWGKPPGLRPRAEWDWRLRDAGARAGHPDCWGCRLAGRGRRGTVVEVAGAAAPGAAGVARQQAVAESPSR
ncbi:HGxxPAAW family protein [Streptomyces sp. NPDC088387]|uniref:HGxxPAAW family protein n=1 Tax=Streptomyces sp. NPDC088387 TaxID=3365859 RepID=UPI00381CF023